MDRVSSQTIKAKALDLGFTTVGIAPANPVPEALTTYRNWLESGFQADMGYLEEHEVLKQNPQSLLEGAQSVIAVTLNYYQDPTQSPIESAGKIARYALGRDYHKVLRSKLNRLGREVQRENPESKVRACVDSAPILDRAYASLAGLGWFGKNTMLIDSKRGSWFFIGLLLTTVPYETDELSVGGCGTCRKCIDACPTGAIKLLGGKYQVDSRSCISYQTIENKGDLSVDTHGWAFGCDICQEVCPFNQPRESQPLRGIETQEPDFRLPLAAKLRAEMSEGQWDLATQGSPIRRAGHKGWVRNQKGFASELDKDAKNPD
jgi:epoxyqueuosine reductase